MMMKLKLITKSRRLNQSKCFSTFNLNGGFGAARADLSFLDRSYMKIVGGEVDTQSSDYMSNYE